MAENTEVFCERIARYIEKRLNVAVEYVSEIPWQERERLFDRGAIHILWLCGLPYIDKADDEGHSLALLAAPVPNGKRYKGMPVYFSDIVVRRDSPYRSFFELRGASWAFNEPHSHSGFNVVRAYLAELGQEANFFGRAVESGAHINSIKMILSGKVAGAAIDSMVLEWFRSHQTDHAEQLRVIDTIGPSPIPPWVVSTGVPMTVRADLRAVLFGMDQDPIGRCILQEGALERFDAIVDACYDPIRRMAHKAEHVLLA